MQKEIDSRLVQSVVLLDRQYLLIERLIKIQDKTLNKLEKSIDKNSTTINHILDVHTYVFTLIDHLVRYQKVASSIPRLSQKTDQFRKFNDSLSNLKNARNNHQHINNDIENNYSSPLLGSISWVSNDKLYNIFLPDIGRERSAPTISYDTKNRSYTKKFCYIHNDKFYDLEKAIIGVKNFNDYIKTWIKIKSNGKAYNTRSEFFCLCAKFEF